MNEIEAKEKEIVELKVELKIQDDANEILTKQLNEFKLKLETLRSVIQRQREGLEKIERYAFKGSGDEFLMWAQSALYESDALLKGEI